MGAERRFVPAVSIRPPPTSLCPGKCWKFLEVLESCGAAGGSSWLCGKRRAMGDSYCKPERPCLFLSDQRVIFASRQSSWSHPSRLESLHPKITLGVICSAAFPSFPSSNFPPMGSGRPENVHAHVLPDDSSQRPFISFSNQICRVLVFRRFLLLQHPLEEPSLSGPAPHEVQLH